MTTIKNIRLDSAQTGLKSRLGLTAFSALMLYVASANATSEKTVSVLQASSPTVQEAYKFSLPALNGDSLSLAELRGKKVYIKFWATWCPQCLAGLEDFSALSAQFAFSPDVAVISIVAPGLNGEVDKAEFIEWANAQTLSFPVYFDETGALLKAFGVKVYPTSVYLDKNGKTLKINMGDEMNPQILAALRSFDAD